MTPEHAIIAGTPVIAGTTTNSSLTAPKDLVAHTPGGYTTQGRCALRFEEEEEPGYDNPLDNAEIEDMMIRHMVRLMQENDIRLSSTSALVWKRIAERAWKRPSGHSATAKTRLMKGFT